VRVGLEDRHVRIEIPLIPPTFAGALLFVALLVFLGVFCFRVWIEVAAGEDDLLAVRPEIAARRLAHAGADAADSAGAQGLTENLIERISGVLFFRLEYDLLAVRRKIPLSGAREVFRHLADV